MGMECARAVVWVFWSWAMYGSNDTIEEWIDIVVCWWCGEKWRGGTVRYRDLYKEFFGSRKG